MAVPERSIFARFMTVTVEYAGKEELNKCY